MGKTGTAFFVDSSLSNAGDTIKSATFSRVNKSSLTRALVGTAILVFTSTSVLADKTDDIVNLGLKRSKDAAASQVRIDTISEATDKVISKYQQESKVVDGLKVYNDRMRRTLKAQEVAMGKLETSIDDASLIERQIVPLMLRMIEGLDQFIAADVPYKRAEREERISRIRGYLTNANISAAERFRQVLEAYSIENAYGKSLDVYRDTLNLDSGDLTVNVLQVGRVGLYYQTLDGLVSGYWDRKNNKWVALDSSFNGGITKTIRIVLGKESNKQLMPLPIAAPESL